MENVDNSFYVNIAGCYRIYYVNLLSDKTHSRTANAQVPLPLPPGGVDERSEDGEGIPATPSQPPSVTALPKGEPRGLYRFKTADESGAAFAAPLMAIGKFCR